MCDFLGGMYVIVHSIFVEQTHQNGTTVAWMMGEKTYTQRDTHGQMLLQKNWHKNEIIHFNAIVATSFFHFMRTSVMRSPSP